MITSRAGACGGAVFAIAATVPVLGLRDPAGHGSLAVTGTSLEGTLT